MAAAKKQCFLRFTNDYKFGISVNTLPVVDIPT